MTRAVKIWTRVFLCSAILSPSRLQMGILTSHHGLYSSLLETTGLGCFLRNSTAGELDNTICFLLRYHQIMWYMKFFISVFSYLHNKWSCIVPFPFLFLFVHHFLSLLLHIKEMHPSSSLASLELRLGEREGFLVNNSIIASLPWSGVYQWNYLLSHR